MSGETGENISAWTIDSLHEHLVAIVAEVDRRYEQRFEAQEKAILKADTANEKRFESVNEFRSTLADQTNTFLPRSEFTALHNSLEQRVTGNTTKLDKLEGRSSGLNAGWLLLGQAISLFGAVIAIVLVLAK